MNQAMDFRSTSALGWLRGGRPATGGRAAALCLAGMLACVWSAAPVWARPRLENICTVQGQQEVRLTGLGLVVGLTGTGDGAKNLPTVRALRAALTRLNLPTLEADLKNADSVAVVAVEATIPRTGLRRGQKIEAFVSATMGAKSLRGGRLLTTPLTSSAVKNELVFALAGGALNVEDITRPTTAKIVDGVDLQQDVQSIFISQQQGPTITLLIDPQHASFWAASEVANVINREFTFEVNGKQTAKAVGPNAVEVRIPPQYRETPVEFVAQTLDIAIDYPYTQAKVILNARTGTVIVTGEVEISPVVIAHKSFSVEVGAAAEPLLPGPFVGVLDGGQSRQSPQQLEQLIKALNQLRVPAADVIAIIRELHATGKLHAELVER